MNADLAGGVNVSVRVEPDVFATQAGPPGRSQPVRTASGIKGWFGMASADGLRGQGAREAHVPACSGVADNDRPS